MRARLLLCVDSVGSEGRKRSSSSSGAMAAAEEAEEEAEEEAADASCFTAQSRPLRAATAPVEADSCTEVVVARLWLTKLPVVASCECAAVFAECCMLATH